jgi:phage baseplate assembly protein W
MASISKKFVDLNPKFEKNPLTGDLPVLKNENAVRQAVKNIVMTQRGERPFRPFFGSTVGSVLFENLDLYNVDEISIAIEDALKAYEPRVQMQNVTVINDIDSNSVEVVIDYTITGIPLDTQSLNLILERV